MKVVVDQLEIEGRGGEEEAGAWWEWSLNGGKTREVEQALDTVKRHF